MNKKIALVIAGLLGLACWMVISAHHAPALASSHSRTSTVQRNPTVVWSSHHDLSLPLRDYPNVLPAHHGNRLMRETPPVRRPFNPNHGPDPLAQVLSFDAPAAPFTVGLNFDGQNADGLAPPDTDGSIGATQYVQWVNVEYNIYDKVTGTKTMGPFQGSKFWTGFAGACGNASNNDGDVMIQYDKLAGRWVAAQMVFSSPYVYCLAVSTTSDATGTYNRYSFPVGGTSQFPDYPKIGVWPDAYYMSARSFLGGFSFDGSNVCAMDRNAMLAGGTAASIQCFQRTSSDDALLPSDLDGTTPPPAGAPNYFLELASSAFNALDMYQFHIDFVNSANTTFTGPTAIPVTAWTELCSNGTNRACIPEPSPGESLDSLGDRMMYRVAYRNYGDHEAIVATHTVNAAAGVAGVRWYEIRSPMSPVLFQSGTIAAANSLNLWMPSIAMDKVGDIAVGFSASSRSVKPSIVLTGRTPANPLNKMGPLVRVVAGGGVQQSTANRWGDYSALNVDPTDDCTFWYTDEYYKTTGSFAWTTRIANFKFTNCH